MFLLIPVVVGPVPAFSFFSSRHAAWGIPLNSEYMNTTTLIDDGAFLDADSADAFWLMFGCALVFLMQAGFAMVEAGSVNSDVVGRVLLKNVFDVCVTALAWWATGYAFAYGADSRGIIGMSGFFYENEGSGDNSSPLTGTRAAKTIGKSFWVFQWAFAGVAATIVSGAIGGRCQFTTYLAYAVLLSSFCYPIVVHSAWSDNGFFSAYRDDDLFVGCGIVDFAGSSVVHATGGFAAYLLLHFVSPRRGRFTTEFEHPPHGSGVVFQTLGIFLMWTGWYGFNGCSSLAISGGRAGVAAHAMFTTTIAAAVGCLTTAGLSSFHVYRGRRDPVADAGPVDVFYPLQGVLAGLVSITASCAVVSHWGAACTGFVAAFVYYGTSRFVAARRIDDVVDAVAVHFACGVWGLISVAFFATEYYYRLAIPDVSPSRARKCQGIFYGGNGAALLAHLTFLAAQLLFLTAVLLPAFFLLHRANLVEIESNSEGRRQSTTVLTERGTSTSDGRLVELHQPYHDNAQIVVPTDFPDDDNVALVTSSKRRRREQV